MAVVDSTTSDGYLHAFALAWPIAVHEIPGRWHRIHFLPDRGNDSIRYTRMYLLIIGHLAPGCPCTSVLNRKIDDHILSIHCHSNVSTLLQYYRTYHSPN